MGTGSYHRVNPGGREADEGDPNLPGGCGTLSLGRLDHIAFTRGKKQVRLKAVLLGVEFVVAAPCGIKRLVSAGLHDFSCLHNKNLIGAPDGRQPVRDDKRRAPRISFAKPS